MHHVPDDSRAERVTLPARHVAGRDDVDMALQDQGRPVTGVPGGADQAPRLRPRGLAAREAGVRAQPRQVHGPQVDVEIQPLVELVPADPAQIEKKQVEVHYLGYYLKWHPQSCYYYAVEHGGFQASPERTPGTYSKYNSIDDRIDDVHYYTTWIKFVSIRFLSSLPGLARWTNTFSKANHCE